MIVHYDLFAGIGGFSLALERVFYDRPIKHIFCEWEQFPTAVLKKHWPNATYYGDIADLVADTDHQRLERSEETRDTSKSWEDSEQRLGEQDIHTTILTGGFPCQPFSAAGRRKGTADDRYKWPDMFAVIRNVRPDWVIAENVRGLVTWNEGMVLETVCADLEGEGYEVQPVIIPAVAVGAPHRRDRIWIIAHAINGGQRRAERGSATASDSVPQEHRAQDCPTGEFERAAGNGRNDRPWENDWREVALTTCHDGVDDGLPRWMDGATISAAKHRRERLKACGNAIVPQVAMEIYEAIKATEGAEV